MTTSWTQQALAERFAREQPGLAAFLRRRMRGDGVSDALQEVLLRAWRFRGQYDATRPLGPWLLAIASRVASDAGRRVGRQVDSGALGDAASAVDPTLGPAESAERRDDVRAVQDAWQGLSEPARSVFRDFYTDGRSVADIGRERGLPESTVKSHLRRARQRIAEALRTAEEPR